MDPESEDEDAIIERRRQLRQAIVQKYQQSVPSSAATSPQPSEADRLVCTWLYSLGLETFVRGIKSSRVTQVWWLWIKFNYKGARMTCFQRGPPNEALITLYMYSRSQKKAFQCHVLTIFEHCTCNLYSHFQQYFIMQSNSNLGQLLISYCTSYLHVHELLHIHQVFEAT